MSIGDFIIYIEEEEEEEEEEQEAEEEAEEEEEEAEEEILLLNYSVPSLSYLFLVTCLPYWLESLFSLPLWPLLAQPESLNSFSSLFSLSSRDHQRKDKEDSREMPHSPSGPESGNLPLALVTSFSGRVYHPLSSLTGSSVTQPFPSSFSCQRQLNIQD